MYPLIRGNSYQPSIYPLQFGKKICSNKGGNIKKLVMESSQIVEPDICPFNPGSTTS